MTNLLFDYSPFKTEKRDKNLISSSLKKFNNSPLSQFSQKDLLTAKKIWKAIKNHYKIFIFAFGGAGSSAKILNSAFPKKNKNVFLIDKIDEESLNSLSSLKKKELKSCHFIFISKSGQTQEILFYIHFLQKLFSKKQLSLKNKVTVLSHSLESPLLKWAKKEGCSIVISKKSLPGRFSFFTLSGLLQSQAYVHSFKTDLNEISSKVIKNLEFFLHHCKKRKEIFCCPFNKRLDELSHWLELSWSESLFKESALRQIPLLRSIAFPDLRHACIEELITKKNTVLFLALDLKSKKKATNLYKQKIKELLKTKQIPYMFIELSLDNKNSLSELIILFYKILFCIGCFSKSNILTQNWVDYFKRI